MKSINRLAALILAMAAAAIPQIVYGSETLSDKDAQILREACQALNNSDKRASCAGVIARLVTSKAKKPTSDQPEWIEIGVGPEISAIQYRLINVRNDQGETLKKSHSDLAAVSIYAQSGRAIGEWVYLPTDGCYAPANRDGIASVQCQSINRSTFILAATDNVRELLMNIRRLGKAAVIKARIIGVHGSAPFLETIDPNAKLDD